MTITVHRLRVMAQAARLGRPASLSADELMEMARIMEGLADKNVSLMAQVKELTARNAELAEQKEKWVSWAEQLGAKADALEAEIKRRDALGPVAYRWRWSDDAPGVWRYTEEPRKTNGGVTAESLFTAAPALFTVWYGSMPESNGKANWTAILHRKGQCISDGITVDRSEYPDRVRYSADEMRYLIGEIAQKPDILAYDANKHSGYVKPAAPAPFVSKPTLLAMIRAWNRAEFPSEAVFEEMRQILKGGAE